MSIVAKFIPLAVVALLVFTEPGRDIWTSVVEWGSDRAAEWFQDTLEENEAQRELRERLRRVEPLCDSDYKPDGFTVSEGQAIALTLGQRKVSCDRVDSEPMDNYTWAIHVDAKGPNGCDFSALIDGKTGEKIEGSGGCPEKIAT